MIITKIDLPYVNDNDEFVDFTLGADVMNDILFEHSFIAITVQDPDPINFFYRRMFEDIYLRRGEDEKSAAFDNGEYVIRISVSEAIGLIKTMIPPVLASRVKELYLDRKNIVESLTHFLMDVDTGTLDYQISTFKKQIGWGMFETKSNYDIERAETLRTMLGDKNAVVVDALLYQDKEPGALFEGTVTEPISLQCVYAFKRKKELEPLLDIIDENKNISVLNVFASTIGYYVELYVPDYTSLDNVILDRYIQKSYDNIIHQK